MKTEIDVALQKPIKYPFKGEAKLGEVVTLYAPLARLNKLRLVLQKELMKAIRTVQERRVETIDAPTKEIAEDQKEEKKEFEAVEVSSLLLTGNADMEEMHEAFKKLLTSGCCRVEDEFDLLESTYNEFDGRDLDNLLATYVANFIMPSL